MTFLDSQRHGRLLLGQPLPRCTVQELVHLVDSDKQGYSCRQVHEQSRQASEKQGYSDKPISSQAKTQTNEATECKISHTASSSSASPVRSIVRMEPVGDQGPSAARSRALALERRGHDLRLHHCRGAGNVGQAVPQHAGADRPATPRLRPAKRREILDKTFPGRYLLQA